MSEMKNVLDEINSRLDMAEEQIKESKDSIRNYQSETQRGETNKEQSISELQENFKQPDTHVIEGPKKKEGR